MDVERSSLCNCVVNFLLEENYVLTAFELLHELLDDGRDAQAIRLKAFFSDPVHFPPDQISRFNSPRVAEPQTLLEEKEAIAEKLAISKYELRLAQEDISKLKIELQKKKEARSVVLSVDTKADSTISGRQEAYEEKRDGFSDLGPLKGNERQDLNRAVKEYLLIAGYRLTAMTFYEEVTDQNLDVWPNSPASVSDALRHYYYQYLSSTTEAAEGKNAMNRQNVSLLEGNKELYHEKESFLRNKDFAESQIGALTKSLETMQKEIKDKESLVQDLKKSWEHQRKELSDCRAEIAALKMHIEGSRSNLYSAANDVDPGQLQSSETYKEEIKLLQIEIENLKAKNMNASDPVEPIVSKEVSEKAEDKIVEIHEDKNILAHVSDAGNIAVDNGDAPPVAMQTSGNNMSKSEEFIHELSVLSSNSVKCMENKESVSNQKGQQLAEDNVIPVKANNPYDEAVLEKGLGTIQILADALPKIVPYVLINHREELLPLIMCAIERHPDSYTRDSLTHTLFNLIKRPDEQQRRIIMDACVSLAKSVGEMRTETELLPQCWEQINHMYEERRLLVAQSCGELAEFVRPEIRDSLILSIVQQLIEDSATVVREAAVHNLAMLLPLFPNIDKYYKVEEMMFQLVCDPAGVVVETSMKDLVPAVVKWGNKLDHVLRVLLSHILSSAQRCPPLSGVEGSLESHLRFFGERERWNVDVLLRMLAELLPFVHHKAIETCPFSSVTQTTGTMISTSVLELYAGGCIEWPAFEWIHVDCFPDLIQLACFLPQKEDSLRNRVTRFLLAVSERFGDSYLTHIMLPVFLVAVGESADLAFFPSTVHSRIKGLKPKTILSERLATICVLPLLLAGVLGAPSKHEDLVQFLRKLLVEGTKEENPSANRYNEIVDAVRFFCTFERHHSMIFNILWEMVVSSHINMKISAAKLLKVIVPYTDSKVASAHILPALVTLGSDPNFKVKYASIDAFGAVAQHFKNDIIVDKIRVQMDAFLEDGSHEATIAVVRALVVAVPHTTERLREYLLSKIFQLSAAPPSSSALMRRRERADAFCEAIRALDGTDLSATSIRELFLPTMQNLLKDLDALDPAHKEALEIIMRERSGGTFETISKVMGSHLGIASSVSSFFGGDGGLGKKEPLELSPTRPVEPPNPAPPPAAEDTRFRRIMRGSFTDMLRGKVKSQDDSQIL
ncbi:lisH domain and HEAT repeat-containing protein KIAA1468 homolog isoform X1 [Cucurbita pepo subsp. pepo]|uniref:lisH domain and HEAT repeat-containing protein KIAA1468 homolog isoform X1 n=2 Tax=Cucurbita pepo subsp. pepo TaxID=3664 RepID=UPI000C9D7697|nr:lisH domain and HEAT repeat-containing protein KIAA1468 homolog isoform X1 [Cucurbita pepo subsp. pepo]XP_023547443.1 lisH domain and HEAT repeat-containing protein KIAA1468 homolog isoform X1 [Cucurbita pepo subsp. pepo]